MTSVVAPTAALATASPPAAASSASATEATASTTTAAAKAFPATASKAATGTISLWLRFVDLESASAKFGAVQRGNRLFGFASVCHLDEGKAARTASITVSDHAYFFDRSMSFEYAP
jgi:hypothetical protein